MKSIQDKTDRYNYQITATNSTPYPTQLPQKNILKKMLIKKM